VAYSFLPVTPPDYEGGSLVNLVATIERHLAGSSPGIPLRQELVPAARSYIVVLFDGLGAGQLDHPDAVGLHPARVGVIDTVFPATTTSALASIATGMTPAGHGLLGYEVWLPEIDQVINTIHWKPLGGGSVVDIDFDAFLPRPNTWERLVDAGLEPVTVQPAQFEGTPLSRVLYRSCRYEGVETYDEWLEATVSLAAEPGRLVFSYFGAVDVAAHLKGQTSDEYAGALRLASALWERLAAGAPDGTAVIGTADHGHVDVATKIELDPDTPGDIHGDGRVILSRSDISHLADGLPATWVDGDELAALFGTGERHPAFAHRMAAGALIADDGVRLLHHFSDKRLIGVHGALSAAERLIPILVA